MKLTLKLVLVVLAVTVFVLSIAGYLRIQREVETLRYNMAQDGRLLGQILGSLLADVWQQYGQDRVRHLLVEANASTRHFRCRWLPPESLPEALDRVSLDQDEQAALWRGDRVVVQRRDAHGQTILSTYAPVTFASGAPGVLEIVESLAGVQQYIRDTIFETLGVGLVLIVLSGCLLLLVGLVLIGRPMRHLIEKTRRVGAGDLDTPLHFRTHDELALEQLRHVDRLKTVGSLASGIAHELGTPLNVVSGRASLIASSRLASLEVVDPVARSPLRSPVLPLNRLQIWPSPAVPQTDAVRVRDSIARRADGRCGILPQG